MSAAPAIATPPLIEAARSLDPKSSTFFPIYTNDFQFEITTYDLRIQHQTATYEHSVRMHKLVKELFKKLTELGNQGQLNEYRSIRERLVATFTTMQAKISKVADIKGDWFSKFSGATKRGEERQKAYATVKMRFRTEFEEFSKAPEKFVDKLLLKRKLRVNLIQLLDEIAEISHFKHIGNFKECFLKQVKEFETLGGKISRRLTFTKNGITFLTEAGRALEGCVSDGMGNAKEDSPNSLENLVYFAILIERMQNTAHSILSGSEYKELYPKARESLLLLQCRYFMQEDRRKAIPQAIKILDKIFNSTASTISYPTFIKNQALQSIVGSSSTASLHLHTGYLSFLLQPHEKVILKEMPYMHTLINLPGMSGKPFSALLACFLAYYYPSHPDSLDEAKFKLAFENLEKELSSKDPSTFRKNMEELMDHVTISMTAFKKKKKECALAFSQARSEKFDQIVAAAASGAKVLVTGVELGVKVATAAAM